MVGYSTEQAIECFSLPKPQADPQSRRGWLGQRAGRVEQGQHEVPVNLVLHGLDGPRTGLASVARSTSSSSRGKRA